MSKNNRLTADRDCSITRHAPAEVLSKQGRSQKKEPECTCVAGVDSLSVKLEMIIYGSCASANTQFN